MWKKSCIFGYINKRVMYNQYHRKYPKVTGWWIYVHRTPNGLYYVGRSQKQISKRWKIGNGYNGTTLEPYIEQYGWDNIEHLVIKDGLTKEEALQWEGRLIKMYTSIGCCINHFNSGGEWSKDHIKYKSKWQTNYRKTDKGKEVDKSSKKKCRLKTENKIYDRVRNYNRNHTPKETPLEAKQKYLQWGYIPDYIKSDDL